MIAWHFPRKELAQRFLDEYETGFSDVVALFSPRQMGKTTFVEQDLLPLMKEHGYDAITIDFWADKSDPNACMQIPLLSWYRDKVPPKKRSVELSVNPKVVVADGSNESLSLQQLFEEVKRYYQPDKGRKLVVFCDEIQHLATKAEFDDAAAALRTFFNHARYIRVILTGSSRSGLQDLFTRNRSPFFNMAGVRELPRLGPDFVRFVADNYEQITQSALPLPEAVRAFRTLNYTPGSFIGVVKLMIYHGLNQFEQALKLWHEDRGTASEFAKVWSSLRPADRAVLRALAFHPEAGIYHQGTVSAICQEIDHPKPANHVVQHALARLQKSGLIYSPEKSLWMIEDQNLTDWIGANLGPLDGLEFER